MRISLLVSLFVLCLFFCLFFCSLWLYDAAGGKLYRWLYPSPRSNFPAPASSDIMSLLLSFLESYVVERTKMDAILFLRLCIQWSHNKFPIWHWRHTDFVKCKYVTLRYLYSNKYLACMMAFCALHKWEKKNSLSQARTTDPQRHTQGTMPIGHRGTHTSGCYEGI